MVSGIFSGLIALVVLLIALIALRFARIMLNQRVVRGAGAKGAQLSVKSPQPSMSALSHHLPLSIFAVFASVAYSWIAAGTKPFTWGADLLCAIAFAPMAAAAFVRFRRMREARRHDGEFRGLQEPYQALEPWLLVVGLLILWELVTYFAGFGGHREEFPTLSVLYNSAASLRPTKAILFLLWLCLGWGLFRP